MYLVIFLTFLILFIFLVIVLLSIYSVKVAAVFNSEQQSDAHLVISWIDPFLKVFITRQHDETNLTINLFSKRVLLRKLKLKENVSFILKRKKYMDYINLAKHLRIINAKLCASYGFLDPAATGVLCGVINLISQYINIDELYNNADFITDRSYFYISAEAEVNAAVSLIRILGRNMPYLNTHALGGNR